MTKDVIISMQGVQFESDIDANIEAIYAGSYYQRDGKHYVLYDEVMEEMEGITKTRMKLTPQMIELTKQGVANVQMVFEVEKKNLTYYHTPFGEILLGIYTNWINLEEKEDCITAKIDYSLDMNQEHIAECTITIVIKSKDSIETIL